MMPKIYAILLGLAGLQVGSTYVHFKSSPAIGVQHVSIETSAGKLYFSPDFVTLGSDTLSYKVEKNTLWIK